MNSRLHPRRTALCRSLLRSSPPSFRPSNDLTCRPSANLTFCFQQVAGCSSRNPFLFKLLHCCRGWHTPAAKTLQKNGTRPQTREITMSRPPNSEATAASLAVARTFSNSGNPQSNLPGRIAAKGGPKNIEGATALRLLRPLSIVPLSFLGFPAQSGRDNKPSTFS